MAKILDIVTNPNEILRNKSSEINPEDLKSAKYKELLEDMAITMFEKDGVGLAAPQIGKNIRLVVLNANKKPMFLINPVIVKKSWAKDWGEEGCLSVPGTFGMVRRHKKLKCNYINREGRPVSVDANRFLARVIQHELDHLDGILFIDKAKDVKKIKP